MVVTPGASVVAVVVVGVVFPVVGVNSGFSVVFVAIVVRPGPAVVKKPDCLSATETYCKN